MGTPTYSGEFVRGWMYGFIVGSTGATVLALIIVVVLS